MIRSKQINGITEVLRRCSFNIELLTYFFVFKIYSTLPRKRFLISFSVFVFKIEQESIKTGSDTFYRHFSYIQCVEFPFLFVHFSEFDPIFCHKKIPVFCLANFFLEVLKFFVPPGIQSFDLKILSSVRFKHYTMWTSILM